jgi:amidophosphoribosyltransferase
VTLTTNPFDDDHLHEECGIFAVYGHAQASAITALGLHALQHRGQEATGIVAFDGVEFHAHRGLGHVGSNFSSPELLHRLDGHAAIGHNRYATTGDTTLRNVQPLFADFAFGGFAIGHNGNLTNAYTLRERLVRQGSLFQSTTDTEIIFHLMATARATNLVERIVEALLQVQGAYSLVALASDMVIGIRDPNGVRPLSLGKVGEAWVLSSETSAFDIIGGEFVRDVEPGELIVIDSTGLSSFHPFPKGASRFCVFEYIYFSRPDSMLEGQSVYEARKRIGAELARESAVEADVVVPVPDSGVPAAIGYSLASGVPFELGIIRSHYVGRTFIQPTEQIRNLGVKMKHAPNRHVLEGKRVILVDDSIVRGTTSRKIVEMVRAAGASEVHMRISSPPTTHSCFYGVDTPENEKLLAHRNSVDAISRLIGTDSLAFISIDGLYRAMGKEGRDPASPQYCDACFTGEYPIPLTDQTMADQPQLTLLREGKPVKV